MAGAIPCNSLICESREEPDIAFDLSIHLAIPFAGAT